MLHATCKTNASTCSHNDLELGLACHMNVACHVQFSLGLSNMALWIRIPLAAQPPPSSPATGSTDPWDTWNALRCTCDHAAKVGVALTVPASLPSAAEINRWLGEPVKALLLPTSVFVSNRRGYPSLSRAHQELLLKFFGYGVQACSSLQHCMLAIQGHIGQSSASMPTHAAAGACPVQRCSCCVVCHSLKNNEWALWCHVCKGRCWHMKKCR